MKRWLGTAALCAATSLMPPSLLAQGESGSSRGEFVAYAGAAWTSPWLASVEGTRLGIGYNPGFGAIGNVWVTPRLGAHLHFAYMPSNPPTPDGELAFLIPEGRLHNMVYDISLAFRPFGARDRDGVLQSLYLFAGGGAVTVHVTGDTDGVRCIPGYSAGGACLTYDWRAATVPQFSAGAGLSLLQITSRVGMFVEGGMHAYRSPFRIGQEWTGIPPCTSPGCQLGGEGGVSMRLGTGVAVTLGAFRPRSQLPLPSAAPGRVEVREEAREEVPVQVCVVVDGLPRRIEARVRTPGADTVLVSDQQIRRPLRAAHPVPAPTASGRDWFVRGENIFLDGRQYTRAGAAREIAASEMVRGREFEGVPLFTLSGAPVPPTTLYLPVQDGCSFQPYRLLVPQRR